MLTPPHWSKIFLASLDSSFSDDKVKVDTGTVSASHLIKLYGTLACKGDSISTRPHRRSAILETPTLLAPVSAETLSGFNQSAMVVMPPQASSSTKSHVDTAYSERSTIASIRERIDIVAYAEHVLGVTAIQQGNEYRLPGNGGFLVNPDKGVWFHRTGQQGGDVLDLIGYGLFGSTWHRHNTTMFTQMMQEAMSYAGIHFNPSSRADYQQAADAPVSDEPLPTVVKRQHNGQGTPTTERIASTNLLMHVDELDALPPIRWLIQDYLPEDSLVEVYGAPSAGKTQVVFDMAQTLATTGKPVIYVVAEGLRGYRARKKAWQQFRKQRGGELYLWREPVQLFDSVAVQAFIETIKPKQPVLVVFDTLSRCSLGADENNQKDMGFILESLDTVRRETGATVIAVHHTNATGGR